MTEELLLNGADIVKVGIGPAVFALLGYRLVLDIPYPVIECAPRGTWSWWTCYLDGGCTCPGDIAKAFAGGADFVMLGGMLRTR